MNDQRDLIEKNDWSDIIIFDAGRYDIFKELYSQHIKGRLRKVWNGDVGTTHEWMKRTFKKEYRDVSYYVSAPQIGLVVEKLEYRYPTWFGFINGHRLIKFDERKPYRVPFLVNERVKKDKMRKRSIIHYMAPHSPYLNQNNELVNITGVSLQELRLSYIRKYKVAFIAATDIIPYLGDRIIITSDHGECLGDCDYRFHSNSVLHDHIIEVPWFEVSGIR